MSIPADTVGEFPKQRTLAFCPTEFKELTQLKLISPTVSRLPKEHLARAAALAPREVIGRLVDAGEAWAEGY